jgi:hypothetical protein
MEFVLYFLGLVVAVGIGALAMFIRGVNKMQIVELEHKIELRAVRTKEYQAGYQDGMDFESSVAHIRAELKKCESRKNRLIKRIRKIFYGIDRWLARFSQ